MRLRLSRMTVAVVLLLTCSAAVAGMKVKADKDPDVDFAVYRTYAWEKGLAAAYPNIQHVIEKNVERELAQVELVKVDNRRGQNGPIGGYYVIGPPSADNLHGG